MQIHFNLLCLTLWITSAQSNNWILCIFDRFIHLVKESNFYCGSNILGIFLRFPGNSLYNGKCYISAKFEDIQLRQTAFDTEFHGSSFQPSSNKIGQRIEFLPRVKLPGDFPWISQKFMKFCEFWISWNFSKCWTFKKYLNIVRHSLH